MRDYDVGDRYTPIKCEFFVDKIDSALQSHFTCCLTLMKYVCVLIFCRVTSKNISKIKHNLFYNYNNSGGILKFDVYRTPSVQ